MYQMGASFYEDPACLLRAHLKQYSNVDSAHYHGTHGGSVAEEVILSAMAIL